MRGGCGAHSSVAAERGQGARGAGAGPAVLGWRPTRAAIRVAWAGLLGNMGEGKLGRGEGEAGLERKKYLFLII